MDVLKYHDWTWQESGSLDQKVVPWGIRRILLYVKGNIMCYAVDVKIINCHLFKCNAL